MGLFDQKTTTNSTSTNTATQTATPWKPSVAPWNNVFGMVNNQLGQNPANPWLDAAGEGFMKTASGAEMGMDPALSAMLDQNAARIGSQVGSMAAGMGRYGSGAAMGDMVDRISAANNPLIAQNFQNQQARMDAARGLLGQFGQYQDERPWLPIKNAAGVLGIGGQMGGTRTVNTTAGSYGIANKPSSPFQDAAGLGGIIGSFF